MNKPMSDADLLACLAQTPEAPATPGQADTMPHPEYVTDTRSNMAAVLQAYGSELFGEQHADVQLLIPEVGKLAAAVRDGEMGAPESMLMGQATALQSIFANLARRASVQGAKNLDTLEKLLRLALRAQNQSRMTLESLAVIKQGPAIFAKQANVSTNGGQQIVSNGALPPPPQPIAALPDDRPAIPMEIPTKSTEAVHAPARARGKKSKLASELLKEE